MHKSFYFLLSNSNLYGLAAALLPTTLLMFGVIDSFFLPILGTAYLAGFMLAKDNTLVKPSEKEVLTLSDVKSQFQEIHILLDTGSDPTLKEAIVSLEKVFVDTFSCVKQTDSQYFDLKMILQDVLPTSINTYLKIPSMGRKLRLNHGQSNYEMLIEQLNNIKTTVTNLNQNLVEQLSSEMRVQSRYIHSLEKEKLIG